MSRRLVVRIGLFLCGCALGAVSTALVERAFEVRESLIDLRQYAERLVDRGDQMGAEDEQAIDAVEHDGQEPCSDGDLEFMRDYVFHAQNIRDIGRVKDGVLYCATGIGRIDHPAGVPVPDVVSGNLKIFVNLGLMISARTTGFVVQFHGVSVVMSPTAWDNLDEPPMYFSAMLYDPSGHRMVMTHGPQMPLSVDEIRAGQLIKRGGVFYQPLCSTKFVLCRVAAEPENAMMTMHRPMAKGFLLAGAFLGGAMALLLIQLDRGHRSMERQLRRAVKKGAITLEYQPIVNLATRAVVGAEVLARWINEEGEQVRPDVFIELAEARGFASRITQLVARRAMEEMSPLLEKCDFRITLNITTEDLVDEEFGPFLLECAMAAGIPPQCVGLEITERSTAEQKMAVEAIAALKSTGYVVYIDDFGTGYSSLAYLHLLDVDAIKVDRAFTQTIGTEAVTASVVPQILAMAEKLGLLVVVEGIETEEQAAYFREAGRETLGQAILGQGWLYGRPVPAAQFLEQFGKQVPPRD
ncbi:MAG: EAL domain-containing protein [Acidobacteriota bacterium]